MPSRNAPAKSLHEKPSRKASTYLSSYIATCLPTHPVYLPTCLPDLSLTKCPHEMFSRNAFTKSPFLPTCLLTQCTNLPTLPSYPDYPDYLTTYLFYLLLCMSLGIHATCIKYKYEVGTILPEARKTNQFCTRTNFIFHNIWFKCMD